jgi:hypothetical protein
MMVYKVFYKEYDNQNGVLLGKLTERRSELRGLSAGESGMRWAIATFGDQVRDKSRLGLLVVPEEME